MRTMLILTGPFAGRTHTFGRRFHFVRGKLLLEGDPDHVANMAKYIGRCYQAFPEASDELRAAQARDRGEPPEALAVREPSVPVMTVSDDREVDSGTSDVRPATQSRAATTVPSDIRSDGTGPAETDANDVAGDADGGRGDSGVHPVGDGHEDTGLPNPAARDQGSERLRTSVMALDPMDDEHWTAGGAPRMDAIERLYGSTGPTRRDVNRLLPGYDREAALALAADAEGNEDTA